MSGSIPISIREPSGHHFRAADVAGTMVEEDLARILHLAVAAAPRDEAFRLRRRHLSAFPATFGVSGQLRFDVNLLSWDSRANEIVNHAIRHAPAVEFSGDQSRHQAPSFLAAGWVRARFPSPRHEWLRG